jgi:hypothetical protein
MKTIRAIAILISFSLMSTGCNHDHSQEHKSSEKEHTHQSKDKEKTHGNHSH